MDKDHNLKPELPAGNFSTWLDKIRNAQLSGDGMDVPCGECTACCRSFQFIHIGSNEKQTLARIPKELLFPAPGQPEGYMLMGYDSEGRCPMLVENTCSIYTDRPLTCRNYDCRIFPATGIKIDDKNMTLIAERTRFWKFGFNSDRDREAHKAVQTAVAFLRKNAESFPGGEVPCNATQLAILAIKVYDVFLEHQTDSGTHDREHLPAKIVNAVIKANKKFEEK